MGPERAVEAVGAVRSDRMTSCAAAKTSDIFVGSLQKRVSGSASKADGVGPGAVLRRFLMKNERLGIEGPGFESRYPPKWWESKCDSNHSDIVT